MDKKRPDFTDLCMQGFTGRSYAISGSGRGCRYGYRHGVDCPLGNIERGEWIAMMQNLIHRAGEDALYQQLLDWYRNQNHCRQSEEELAFSVLQSHSRRLFDNQAWVDYIKFNEKYRPEVLVGVSVATVAAECCGAPFLTTQALLDKWGHSGTTCCQICGRWAAFEVMSVGIYAKQKGEDAHERNHPRHSR